MKVEAIDLFCGVGGLTNGLRQAQIKVLAGLDNDASCQYAYEKNNNSCKFIKADITDYDFIEMKEMYSKDSIRVLVGCAPCQPFSTHSSKLKNRQHDERWNLIEYFVRAIKILEPHIISMENVKGLMETKVFDDFVESVDKLGYKKNYDVVYCPNYGIPQGRRRLVFMGSKLGAIGLPEKTTEKNHYVSVGDTIKKLPKIKAGETCKKDAAHKARRLSPINLKRIRQSRPGGTWCDWDEGLLPDCYRKASGQSYKCVYGRMKWDGLSPTITTKFCCYGTGRFGHPVQDRAISIREAALLQTFDKSYDFGQNMPISTMSRHIGNAVPPKLGLAIGQLILQHVKDCYSHE